MKNIKLIFTIIILLIKINVFAQKEANNWIISIDNYMSFNSGSPEMITPPPPSWCSGWSSSTCNFFFTWRCCSSISDADGNLLLYTNGERIFTAALDTVFTGQFMHGNQQSSQCLIIPRPYYPNRYYVITTAYAVTMMGARYYEIDMTYSNGLGGIVYPSDLILLTPSCQKVTAVYHANGKDIWLMVHEYDSNAFHAFLVTQAGITQNAVISSIGIIHTEPIPPNPYSSDHGSAGEMKFSTNGKKVAVAILGLDLFEVFDFDNETGIVSNPFSFFVENAASVEFSPDGTLAYIGNTREANYNLDTAKLYQVNMLAGDSNAIINSFLCISNSNYNAYINYLQLAPDGKIYNSCALLPPTNDDYMSIIQSPNTTGIACNLDSYAFMVPNSYCGSGFVDALPNFFRSYLDKNIIFENTCYGDTTLICTQTNTDFDSIRWEFEDVTVGLVFSIANQDTVYYTFSEPGSYEIILKRYRNGYLDEDKRMLYINPVINITLGNDTTICEGSELILQATDSFASFAWVNDYTSDTIFSDTAYITTQGNYWPIVTNFYEYCGSIDTINVTIHYDSLFIGNDTTACLTNPITLDATIDSTLSIAEEYTWCNGDTTASLTATESGLYWVEVTQGSCTFYDTINIFYDEPLTFNFPDTTYVCDSIAEELSVGDIYGSFLWSPTGETTPEIMVVNSCLYSVTASNGCGEFIDSTQVISTQTPIVNLGNDTVICSTDSILLDATSGTLSVVEVWSTGDTTATIWVSQPAQYFVTVSNACGTVKDSIIIENDNPAIVVLGSDTIICFGDSLQIIPIISNTGNLQWSSGQTTQNITVTDENEYILTLTNACGIFSDTLYLAIQVNNFEFTQDTLFISNADSIIINSSPNYEGYLWSTYDTTQSIYVSTLGIYSLTVTDTIGCTATDSIIVAYPFSISETSSLQNIKIYPNPVTNILTIEGLRGNEEIRVMDLLGREIFNTHQMTPSRWLLGHQMSFANHSAGVYFLSIKRKNEIRFFKVVKR